ncbi:MAG: efflux RND transporter periplasmic adaptor subunit [Gemmatimonadales bacterium]|nr:efflux RND transporter periplasmic adaptor subunit [Candidatus Palauibacter irciniicola]MYC19272.1 efflux RND transporter periplasmic adaptor subunit [Gemmatimonadales bacterium]
MRVTRALAFVAVLSCVGCDSPPADQAAAATHSHAGGGVVTHWTESLELFVEYPPHVRDVRSEPWAIYLTWLEDWKPVREGRLVLLLRGPGGAREEIVLQAPATPGVYAASPTLTETGTWRADLTLTARGADHAIPVGQLEVFTSEEALPHDEEQPLPGLIALPKEEQWAMPFEVAVAETRRIPNSIPVTGEVTAPAGGLAHVSTPVEGLLLVQGPSPAPGERVREGETLALIAPTSLDDSYARMRADVVEAEREADRAERLFAAGAIAERRLEEARHNLEVARAAFEAVGGIRSADEDGGSDPHVYRLRSPIGGVIADRHVAPGEHVAVGTHAFTVVRPDTLWFVARVPARHAEAAGKVRGAWFTVEGATRALAADRVVSVGSIIDAGSRALPIRFAVANPDGVLKVGMLAEGHVLLGEPVEGVAVPTPAILDEDGLSVVYVKVGGEAFQRRVVETGPSDGSWTIVHSGVASGEQVVAVGAYQVRLASLGDVEISDHGHPH